MLSTDGALTPLMQRDLLQRIFQLETPIVPNKNLDPRKAFIFVMNKTWQVTHPFDENVQLHEVTLLTLTQGKPSDS